MTQYAYPGRFPASRPRRLRSSAWVRSIVAESRVAPENLVQAIILRADDAPAGPITAMPGISRMTVDEAIDAARRAQDAGVPALALFPYTQVGDRDATGRQALDKDNLMCVAAKAIKAAVPDIGLIGDVALDPYTDHGHDGLMVDGIIVNDETVSVLSEQAIILAEAGFDMLAPSDMMDGRVGAIRQALDNAGFEDRMILSYAVKYASRFYGPYRDAIGSQGVLQGDKRTYQMDPRNHAEGLREITHDLAEGADIVMVKPGMPYLDMVTRVKSSFSVPVAVFQVSGEYAMLANAAEAGAFDFKHAALEALDCFRRAGADMIICYYATDAATWLNAPDA